GTDRLFRLGALVEPVATSNVVGRYKVDRGVAEAEQAGQGDLQDAAITVVERDQCRSLGQPGRIRQALEQGLQIDHLPAVVAQVTQLVQERRFRNVVPRLPGAG